MNESSIELSDNISSFDDEKFKNYLFVLKTILIILYKIKLKVIMLHIIIQKNLKKLNIYLKTYQRKILLIELII